ncbi:MAG: serine hydrolase [Bacteroidota bacterium]
MKPAYLFVLIILTCIACKNASPSKANNTYSGETAEISFSIVDLKKTEASEVKYADIFNLHEDDFLSIHFELKQPLIKSLQELAPGLSDEELLEKGNFQFSFFVDGEKIYTENLNTGAGTIPQKTEELKKVVRLKTPEQINFWGWFIWQRFMKLKGGYEALSEGTHSLGIEVRAYIQDDKLKQGDVLAQGEIRVEVPKLAIDESLVPVQKIQANSGWDISTDGFDKTKIEELNRKIAEVQFAGVPINGLVIIKDGKLLLEEYFHGANRNSLHDVRSVGKSFASTVLGIAIAEQYIKNEEQLLGDFYDLNSFKNHSQKKDSVSLKTLLTMTSGFLGNDWDPVSPGNEENMYPTDDWVRFALDLPMHKTKRMGIDFNYFTAGAVILGDIIHKSVPEGLVAYADKKLFAPLGISNYQWQYTPQNVGNTAGGIQLRALDFAKYGQLYKNKGEWKGQQILSPAWVDKSLARQVSQAYGGKEDVYYGYLFWNKVYRVAGKDYEVSFCTGNGGNKIFIFKDIPFVVVITASAYGLSKAHKIVDNMMLDYILPAVLAESKD